MIIRILFCAFFITVSYALIDQSFTPNYTINPKTGIFVASKTAYELKRGAYKYIQGSQNNTAFGYRELKRTQTGSYNVIIGCKMLSKKGKYLYKCPEGK